jgi:hypothetical protein
MSREITVEFIQQISFLEPKLYSIHWQRPVNPKSELLISFPDDFLKEFNDDNS